jgi:hypothetical protein
MMTLLDIIRSSHTRLEDFESQNVDGYIPRVSRHFLSYLKDTQQYGRHFTDNDG